MFLFLNLELPLPENLLIQFNIYCISFLVVFRLPSTSFASLTAPIRARITQRRRTGM
jgi:hypothetical protein